MADQPHWRRRPSDRPKNYFCGHCHQHVSKTLFFQHRKLYYDKRAKQWNAERVVPVDLGEDFDFARAEATEQEKTTAGQSSSVADESSGSIDFSTSPTNNDEEDDMEQDSIPDSEFNFDQEEVEVWLHADDSPVITEQQKITSPQEKLVIAYVKFLFLWQIMFHLSDVGLGILLSFFATLVAIMGRIFNLETVKQFSDIMPRTVRTARRLVGNDQDTFQKWACCPSCSALYPLEDCSMRLPDGSLSSRECTFIRFPNHPQSRFRLPCGVPLMKTVKTSNGTTYLYPRQMYCYNGIIAFLREKLQQPEFMEQCEAWRKNSHSQGEFNDIFDGQIWNDFINPEGVPFLSQPYNFALSLNVDWFQPYKNSVYATGAIYVAVLNLPRTERFKSENILLLGVIPGPKEPELTINTFLKPFVKELLELWNAVTMQTYDNRLVFVRAALICVACDIPAARKVCGFCGHRALHGCSRCMKSFPTDQFGEKPDYRGFDRAEWETRTLEKHKELAYKHMSAKTLAEQKSMERESGCRYSVLLNLPYFNPIRMCIVDPMHNLLLGTAKHMLSVWTDIGLLSPVHFKKIQTKVDSFVTPQDIGRIPSKIASGFSGFKADQWRNWTIIYSLVCLKTILPYTHYNCWQLFVKACHLLCKRSITLEQLDRADKLLIEFCETFQQLYGKQYCTINLHLHGHLKECVLDYGPVYSFWLFPFERLNGVLGSFHTNCHDISLQLMRRFLDTHKFGIYNWPAEYKEEFSSLIHKCVYSKGSLRQTSLQQIVVNCDINSLVEPLPPAHEASLEPHQRRSIVEAVCTTQSVRIDEDSNVNVLPVFLRCSALKIGGVLIGSQQGRYQPYSVVMVHPLRHVESGPRLAKINHFARCSCVIKTTNKCETITLWLAAVNYFHEHNCKVWFGYPTEVWATVTSMDMYYLPLTNLANEVAYTSMNVDFGRIIGIDKVLIVVPLYIAFPKCACASLTFVRGK